MSNNNGFEIDSFIYWLFPLVTILGILWIFGKDKIVNCIKVIKCSFSNILIPNYFQLSGCITRKQFIINSLILLLISSCIMGILISYKCLLGVYILSIICIYIFSILVIKRIHDTGSSAYQYLALSIISPLASINGNQHSIIAIIGTLCGFYMLIYILCIAFISSKKTTLIGKYKYEKILFIFGICTYIIMSALSYKFIQSQIRIPSSKLSTQTRYVPHNNYKVTSDVDDWEEISPDEYYLLGTGRIKK